MATLFPLTDHLTFTQLACWKEALHYSLDPYNDLLTGTVGVVGLAAQAVSSHVRVKEVLMGTTDREGLPLFPKQVDTLLIADDNVLPQSLSTYIAHLSTCIRTGGKLIWLVPSYHLFFDGTNSPAHNRQLLMDFRTKPRHYQELCKTLNWGSFVMSEISARPVLYTDLEPQTEIVRVMRGVSGLECIKSAYYTRDYISKLTQTQGFTKVNTDTLDHRAGMPAIVIHDFNCKDTVSHYLDQWDYQLPLYHVAVFKKTV